jgi:hypothetical protein
MAIALGENKRGVRVKIRESTSITAVHKDFINVEGYCH